MTMIISGSDGIEFPDGSDQTIAFTGNAAAITVGVLAQTNGGTGTTIGYNGFKNRIINGAMTIDQRNAGASVTPTSGQYTLDRWVAFITQTGKFTVQQNAGAVTPPAGFTHYLGVTSTSAYTLSSSDEFEIVQMIEGFNTADLDFGKSTAQTITLSFWVRSSLTGTFGGTVYNSAVNWVYPFSYTIASANTWQLITVTIPGQTSGVWNTNNASGIQVLFSLGAGSARSTTANSWVNANRVGVTGQVNIVGTNGATFYITGVQLEKGSTATSFDYRPYGTELALCERYFELLAPISIMFPWNSGSQIVRGSSSYRTTKRATPTITMGTKLGGTGTITIANVRTTGVIYAGNGALADVVSYDAVTADSEL